MHCPTSDPSLSLPQDLMRALEEVNAGLQRFAGVNRKALDQYVDFSNQREELGSRLKEQVGVVSCPGVRLCGHS